jgi:hypothetical protein
MPSPEAPGINESSLTELDREMEEYLGESALTLFEELSEPSKNIPEVMMGGTGSKTLTPFGKGTADDWDDWDD